MASALPSSPVLPTTTLLDRAVAALHVDFDKPCTPLLLPSEKQTLYSSLKTLIPHLVSRKQLIPSQLTVLLDLALELDGDKDSSVMQLVSHQCLLSQIKKMFWIKN
jgi:hypothetical protein